MNLSPEESRALLDLARSAIRAEVLGRPIPPPAIDVPALQQRAGCFVSLHDAHTHRLRGCVGRMESDEPLATLLPQIAASSLRDPRFEDLRITPADLAKLEIEITLIPPLRDADSPLDFDLRNEGILLSIGRESGCFLPQVARETGWPREKLLSRLCAEKLGLPEDAWRGTEAKVRKFEAQIIGPVPLIDAMSS